MPAAWRCNGRAECRDATDEAECEQSAAYCAVSGRWRCGDGACVAVSQLCDGAADCADSSDEAECGEVRPATSAPQPGFSCCDGNTVGAEQQCDGTTQCPDGSDEFYCLVESE